MKGSEPLPYTADEITDMIYRYGKLCRDEVEENSYPESKLILDKLHAIAERYEYMNMHFNPAKSLITEDEQHFPYCDPEREGR